ncbi:hypothetical protein AVEN_56935-1 [Araneus ventricosus]|uniref:BESS domain-containing protein n=1 Tax=Araneus ventricosus TaxID=182803 RepID=A0A4Y2EU60_ARAVE|nr:hypothetical protein AVEN_56935-1 [Araneus ventricosus]
MSDSFLKSMRNEVGKRFDERKTKRSYIYHKQRTFLQAVHSERETLGDINEDEGVVNNDASEAARTDEPDIAPGPYSMMPKRRKSDPFEKEVLKVLQENVGQGADEMFLLSQLPYIKKWRKTDKLQFQIHFLQLIQQYSNVWESTDVPTPSPENSALSSSSTTSKAPS